MTREPFIICNRYKQKTASKIETVFKIKSRRRDSNPRPADYKSAALAN